MSDALGKPSAVYANRMERYPDEVWLIWSNKWGCWYRADCSGYTAHIEQAGLYDRTVAANHYCGAVPKKHRDTEPFPLSAVRDLVRRRIDHLRAAAEQTEAMLSRLEEHLHAPAQPLRVA